jgi:hypothetical protein
MLEVMVYCRCTFEVLGREKDRANMTILDQGLDLFIDSGAIKAHHEELARLSFKTVSLHDMIAWWFTADLSKSSHTGESSSLTAITFLVGPCRTPFHVRALVVDRWTRMIFAARHSSCSDTSDDRDASKGVATLHFS